MTGLKDGGKSGAQGIQKAPYSLGELSPEHYFLILLHRKWLVLLTFLIVSAGTALITRTLPDVYTAETVVLVNPQQVPERFVAPTVTGDVRNRLGALSQQILSATRLQTIIDRFNLYAEQRKKLPHEVVVNLMRNDISVKVLDLQGFKIAYSGREPRVVAQVTNELASLFIEENLKARERMVTGTSEFIQNQLDQTRKDLEAQEARIRDFKLKHVGEMPEQQLTNLQLLGQLQAQLQGANDALSRAEQQRSYLQALLESQSAPTTQNGEKNVEKKADPVQKPSGPSPEELQLAALLSRYGENHPDVQRFKRQIEEQRQTRERAEPQAAQVIATTSPEVIAPPPLTNPSNPATQAQLNAIEGEIAQRKNDQQRLTESISTYQARVESVPFREQEIADLVRDYGISKDYYSQLLGKKLAAETSTQLEVRQKGEQFMILDPAQVPERPSQPNRLLLNAGGSLAGLVLGLVVALATELLGITVTSPEQIAAATGVAVLGVIPILRTRTDRRRRRWAVAGAATGAVMLMLVGAFFLYHFQDRIF